MDERTEEGTHTQGQNDKACSGTAKQRCELQGFPVAKFAPAEFMLFALRKIPFTF